jgi:hypothetical protein
MMDFSFGQYMVFAGIAIMTAGLVVYTRDTLQGRTKPNRVSWLLWSIAPLIGSVAAFSDGVRMATLPVFLIGLGPLVVFVASFVNKDAYWKLEKSDYACGLVSLLALILWQVTNEPVVAIVFAILSDALAALPTLIKSWKFPETESGIAYATTVFGAGTSFLVLQNWNFSEWAFPLWIVCMNIVLVVVIYRKSIFLNTTNEEA